MKTITIDGDRIRLRLEGMDRIWSLKRQIDIPLKQVRSVEVAPSGLRPRGLRAPGTAIPGRFYAGTWRWRGSKEFWYVRNKQKALVLELDGGEYTRVAIEVDEPLVLAAEIEQARDGLQEST